MSTEGHSIEWPSWLNAGWAFLLAIFGWVWHAGRLASKVTQLETELEEHLKDYKKVLRDISEIKESLAFIKGKNHHPKYLHESDEEDE